MDEESLVPGVEEAAPTAPPPQPAWSPWCDLPPPSRPFAERDLMNWVEHVFRSGWPEPAETVKPCWPWHADAVATLRGLKARLDAAYSPHVKDGEIGAAPLYRMVDWDANLEHALPRWKDSFRSCPLPPPDEGCSRSKPGSYSELSRPQNAAETDQGAQGAWGAVPPDLPPSTEPWEVARGIADAQATATKEEVVPTNAETDAIYGEAETW